MKTVPTGMAHSSGPVSLSKKLHYFIFSVSQCVVPLFVDFKISIL